MTILRCSVIGVALFCCGCSGIRSATVSRHGVVGSDSDASVDVGDRVCIAGADFSRSERSLIIATDRTCTACQVSGGLFAAFAARAKREQIPIFIVDATYDPGVAPPMNTYGGRLLFARGKATGIRRVPTMLLINSNGIITNMWNGLVQQGKEDDTVNEFFNATGKDTIAPKSFDMQQLASLARDNKSLQVIKVGDAADQSGGVPIRGELRIPLRDLDMRGPHELNRNGLVIVDCRATAPFDCQSAMLILRRRGFQRVAGLMLSRLGQSPACR